MTRLDIAIILTFLVGCAATSLPRRIEGEGTGLEARQLLNVGPQSPNQSRLTLTGDQNILVQLTNGHLAATGIVCLIMALAGHRIQAWWKKKVKPAVNFARQTNPDLDRRSKVNGANGKSS